MAAAAAAALHQIAFSGKSPDSLSDIGKDFLSKCLRVERWTTKEMLQPASIGILNWAESPTSVLDGGVCRGIGGRGWTVLSDERAMDEFRKGGLLGMGR